MIGRRAAAGAIAAVLGLCGVAALAPGTSGALSATVASGTGEARAAYSRWFSCAAEVERPALPVLAALPLDDPTGSTSARVSAGSDVDAAYSTAATTTDEQPLSCPRDSGGAWAADGSTLLQIGGIPAFDACTIELWLRTTDRGEILLNGTVRRVRPIRGGRQLSWALATTPDGGVQLALSGTELLRTSAAARIDDGRWHHVAVVIRSDGTALMIDGAPAASTDSSLPNSLTLLRVGGGDAAALPRTDAGAGGFRGALRYLLVEDGALDARTIREHVAAGRLRS